VKRAPNCTACSMPAVDHVPIGDWFLAALPVSPGLFTRGFEPLGDEMKPFFKYFGSKWRLASQYPAPRGVVCEPFAGGAGYSVAHDVERAILVDSDERVCALWEYLIGVSGDEIRSIPTDLESGASIRDMGLPPEWLLFLSCRINTSPFRYTVAETSRARQYWNPKIRERVATQVERIRGWRVIHGDYTEAPEADTTFVDAPYQVQGHAYRDGSRGLDFDALGRWCQSRAGSVIACEQPGADWLPWNRSVTGQRTFRHGKPDRSPEVFWVSGLVFSRQSDLFEAESCQ